MTEQKQTKEAKTQALTVFAKIAETVENAYSPEQIAIIKNNIAKNTTDSELAYFVGVCAGVGLNPLLKEIWCYKDYKGNLLVFAGRDGFLAKALKSPLFSGLRSSEICKNDEWEIDIPMGIVKHKITKIGSERGEIIGAYAFVFKKDCQPTLEFVEFKTYCRIDKDGKPYSAWKTHPSDMIKKVAETHALKKAFGLSSVQSEYDFENGKPINTTTVTVVEDKKDLAKILEKQNKKENEKSNI